MTDRTTTNRPAATDSDNPQTMNEPSVASVVQYPDELLVELTGEDDAGEITVVSYQFEYGEERPDTVRPKHDLDEPHRAAIEEALDETDYRLVR